MLLRKHLYRAKAKKEYEKKPHQKSLFFSANFGVEVLKVSGTWGNRNSSVKTKKQICWTTNMLVRPRWVNGQFPKVIKSHQVISQKDSFKYIRYSGSDPKRIKTQMNKADPIPNMIRKIGYKLVLTLFNEKY